VPGIVGEPVGDAVGDPIEDRQQIVLGGTAQPQQRFDKRVPGLRGFPGVKDKTVTFSWGAKYIIGKESVILTGRSHCTFDVGLIVRLHDEMVARECEEAWELVQRRGKPMPS